MIWLEITVSTNSLGADIVAEALMRLGAKGAQIVDRADVPDPDKPHGYWELIDQSLIDDMPEDVRVKAWFSSPDDVAALDAALSPLPALCGFDIGTLAVTRQQVNEADWADAWKKAYKPFRAGKKLVICPSWERYDKQPGDLVLTLDPGMAFGTGTHETTALCVELIEEYYHGGALIDVGTGSGILAISAALLGAKDVLAIDIDPVAVRVAKENVERNGAQATVTVREGDLTKGVTGAFDFAVANILADVIRMLASPLKACLNPGATFVCSGIIREREDDVREALTQNDYDIIDCRRRGEWVALVARMR